MSAIKISNEKLLDSVLSIFSKLGLNPQNSGTCFGLSGSEAMWSAIKQSALIDSINPATSELIAQVSASQDADYEQIMSMSLRTFQAWRVLPAPQRGEYIRLIGEKLREYKDPLGSLVSLEMGKIKQEGDGEVQEMIDIADFAVGQSRMLYGNTMHSERVQHRMYEQWHPVGPVAVISAFNFPVAVWAWNAFIAAICGNTVIWKPSPKTPLCAIAVQSICNQVMAESGFNSVFSLFIPSKNELVEKLVKDTRVPLVSFTGSSTIGRKVGTWVAERLGRSLLELSGNNAIIIDETADLNLAIPAVIFGFVGTAGQRCTSTRRLIVHESRMEEVQSGLAAALEQVKIGNPLDSQVLMGPLIDEQAVEVYTQTIEEINAMDCEIIYGGEAFSGEGNYVAPTIVLAQNDHDFVQRETFAPILYIMSYSSLDEAIEIQNGVSQGLSSALFTESMRSAEKYLSAMGSDCGIANINIGTSGAEIGGAFGGEKDTGGGREAGSDSWKAYMRRQTNTINWSSELPLAQGIKFDL